MGKTGNSHRSVPAQELHSRAVPSVGGSITTQSLQPQGEISEEGRKKIKQCKQSLERFFLDEIDLDDNFCFSFPFFYFMSHWSTLTDEASLSRLFKTWFIFLFSSKAENVTISFTDWGQFHKLF